jgi:hypothetical protein
MDIPCINLQVVVSWVRLDRDNFPSYQFPCVDLHIFVVLARRERENFPSYQLFFQQLYVALPQTSLYLLQG